MNITAPIVADQVEPAAARPVILSFRGVTKTFVHEGKSVPAVEGIDLDIGRGEFVALLGPSGCGKTTVLNLAAGLLRADAGTITYVGHGVAGPNTRVGYLTQADALLPWRTVIGNVTLPLEIRGVPRAERRERAIAVLDKVGLAGFGRHFPGQLSGGMRKRAALARTLVYAPETLLLDEPFSALDAQTRLLMQQQLRRLADDLGLTVVLVTHDLDEAISLADRIAVFSPRPARLLADIAVARQSPRPQGSSISMPTALHEAIWGLLSPELGEALAS
jgi:NitT/TauT family transport system ATP-binding protein